MVTFTTRPTLRGTFGMVAATHYLASASGMAMLERGGNAADAAVAAGFVLHVVEPHLNGPGGEVPIIVARPGEDPRVLCGQGTAPAGATIGHYRDELGLDVVPGTGPLAAAIPGAFDAWMVLLRDVGTMRLREVLEPAMGYARHGHDPLPQLCATVDAVRDLFAEHWSSSAELWLGADGPRVGRLFRNVALARTWERLCDETEEASGDRVGQIEEARRIWREGFIAEAVVAQSARPTRDTSGRDHVGVLDRSDLAGWEATWEPTVSASWGEWTVDKCGPWSQGPVFLQQLEMLDDVAPGEVFADGLDAGVVHRFVESAKLAFADRDGFYGDSGEVPMAELLAAEYARSRRGLVGPTANGTLRPGRPRGRVARWPKRVRGGVVALAGASGGRDDVGWGSGEPTVRADGLTRGDTCQVDVIDASGLMIAATPSGGWLQSNPTIPELGFCLGTRLQMTWLDEGLPSSLMPERRPRTTLSPSIASWRGIPALAFGTPGGDQQDQWTFHFFVRVADEYARSARLELQQGIDAVNWHTDSLVASFHPRGFVPNSLVIEGRAGGDVVAELRERGHDVTVGPDWSEGRICAVGRDPVSGILCAGANPRGMQGYAVGR